MKNTEDILMTNVQIYYAIAKENYEEMKNHTIKHTRPKPNGEAGLIKIFDPKQTGFKNALITIVFCGMCLDALLHLYIGTDLGRGECKKEDHKRYEDKLDLLGCKDNQLVVPVNVSGRCEERLFMKRPILTRVN